MINKKMYELGNKGSDIRELFEYGKKRKALVGNDNVFDFSLGNPNVSSPKEVNETLIKLLQEEDSTVLHGYTSAPGDINVRKNIPPFFLFERNSIGGVKFRGLLVPGYNSVSSREWLTALWAKRDEGGRFQNYKSIFIDCQDSRGNIGILHEYSLAEKGRGCQIIRNPDIREVIPEGMTSFMRRVWMVG